MKYRILGRTGEKISAVGLGTWQYGGEWGHTYTQEEVDAIFDAARDTGITLVDTAECYGDHLSEEFIGRAVARDRKDWFLATKFGHKFNGFLERDRDFTPGGVISQVEASLRALQTDYIDLLQCHSAKDDEFDNPELWAQLGKLVEQGKVRFLGLSISPQTNVYQTEKAVDVGASSIQVVYNRLQREAEEGVLPACTENNLGVLARVPLASGFLSGKYAPGTTFSGKDVRAEREQQSVEKNLLEVERIRADEVPEGMDMASWALAWCLNNTAVTAVIPGCKNPQQVRKNAAAADM